MFITQKHTKLIKVSIAVVAVLAIVLVGWFHLQSRSQAADMSKFNPGNIMSDAVMSNRNTMTVQQIQTFLDSKNPCNNRNIHMADWYPHLNYNIRDGRFVCMAQERFNGKSAAQIIWQAGQDYNINPQVLIVLLEKEQGLVSDTWPNHVQYRTATGFGCPDTAPCEAQYFGLENQLRLAANLFRTVLDGGWSNYPVGSTFVQYHPNASCGGTTVNIQNRATSALYRYTPYQPNQAALNAGYGTGNSCSSYGNRNFWALFSDWFSSPTGSLLRWSSVSQRVYADASRTQQLPYSTVLHPEQTAYVEIRTRNTGDVTWNSSNTRLGTERSRDRSSVFHDASWISNNRAASLVEPHVAPGEIGTFRFTITAPTSTGNYTEYFNIVITGQGWLRDIGFFLPIRVEDTRQVTLYSDSSRRNPISNTQVNKNSTVYARARIVNNTHIELPAETRIATTGPADRSSPLQTADWRARNRVVQLGVPLARGQAVNVDFTLQAPQDITTTDEWFGLVVDGQGWIEQDTIRINFVTREKPQDVIITNQTLRVNETLTSGSGGYTLTLQSDGNLVLRSNGAAVWASNTVRSGANRLVVQGDGNLVLYASSRAVWASNTVRSGANRLVVQGDGNLVLRSDRAAAWASNTVGR